jgi:adenosylcobinamide-GDP ribazoletransferase
VVHRRPGDASVNAVRLVLGTLTVLPVRPPASVDRRTAGRAMVLAPLVGLLLAVVVLIVLWVLGGGTLLLGAAGHGPSLGASSPSSLVAAALTVALLALLTRAMHLDGLADVADGLGSGRDRERALAVMRQSDIGPFGVVTLLLVLLLQVACLEQLVQAPAGQAAIVGALLLSRFILPAVCLRGVPSARPDGLGAMVAGSVGLPGLLVAAGLAAAAWLLVPLVAAVTSQRPYGGLLGPSGFSVPHVLANVVVPLLLTGLFARHCVRRFGGITGDVLGACVEVCFTTVLLVAAI